MNRRHLTSTVLTAFAAWALLSAPAYAGQHRENPRAGAQAGGGQGRAVERGQAQRQAPAPQTQAQAPRQAPQAAAPRPVPPQTGPIQQGPRAVPRADNRGFDRNDNRGFNRNDNRRFDRNDNRGRVYVQPRVIRPGVTVRPYGRAYFSRPYYSFRPRFSIGFGLWAGYPVLYPSYNPYYAYPYPVPAEPYPGTVAPTATGGLSFDINPPEAGVYVDGEYAGVVGEFTANDQPLTLAPGRHHVEIREPGYQVMAFDVDIFAGQVIPYQGAMQPQ